jgi:putative membrane protein insertion efficiency factor
MKPIALTLIRLYQRTLSPDHGPLQAIFPTGYCKFYPSCSEYGYQAIERHGFWRGTLLAARRVARCNPWSQAGPDPVPEAKKKAAY